ncbi:MAG TPA: hypothetical protein VID96_01470, partial [Xanthobacteraceae bacterium]
MRKASKGRALVVGGSMSGLLAALLLRDAPGRTPPVGSQLTRLADTLRLRVTWQLSGLYAIGFGGYVAFSVY